MYFPYSIKKYYNFVVLTIGFPYRPAMGVLPSVGGGGNTAI